MLISISRRFVFVANSKAASTSIEKSLSRHADVVYQGSPDRKHINLENARVEFESLFSEVGFHRFFKFGVMRDPVSWILSWFRYRKRRNNPNALPGKMTFDAFWERKDWNFIRTDGTKRLQRDFFVSSDGKLLADYIIPYHELEPHYRKVCKALGVSARLPRVNVSQPGVTEAQLSGDTLSQLREFYTEDYELFNRLDSINANMR
ncbi:sulfotransferase family 2 domain-containing protein [Elongatibacter sediminis]|uniref:Sulfotransferase family 2 domain-containing protein n=1 Tax=Elongatibacter sediminis TaxID=3119006 RepID=A0AAW9R8P0_9GAMM